MDSFYGGKQGVSFIIKETFNSVDSMTDAFSKGANYTDVWYGEYCLISTINKNSADNGKIFRRGLNYLQAPMYGAELIGQIVGPSSGTPWFQMMTIDEVKEKAIETLEQYDERKVPLGYEYNEDGEIIGYKIANYAAPEDVGVFPFGMSNNSLVPGKYEDTDGTIVYNDDIKWTWCNIRKANEDADSWFYIGFEFPYPVIEYTVTAINPYDEDGNVLDENVSIEKIDDGQHPFYSLWNIGVPKGIRGDCLRNLRVIEPDNSNKDYIYTFNNLVFENGTLNIEKSTPGYDGIEDDIAQGRQIMVCDFCTFDDTIYPDLDNGLIYLYLGDFNVIDSVTLTDDGTLSIGYTHDDSSVYNERLKWITNAELNNETGHFQITYNTYEKDEEGNHIIPEKHESYETYLDWVREIRMDADGTITAVYTTHEESFPYEIRWIDYVSLDPETGIFRVKYNTDQDGEFGCEEQLDWVKDITIDEDGTITIHHVNQNYPSSDGGQVVINTKLKNITNAAVTDDGIFTLIYNDGTTTNVKDAEILDQDFKLKMVENVLINKSHNGVNGELTKAGLDSDKRIQIKYNSSDQSEFIGDPINYIEDMVIRNQDYHLLVLYNDPTHRYNPMTDEPLDSNQKDKYGNKWVPSTTVVGSNGLSLNEPNVYWRDYGTIKDYDGILVGLNVTNEEVIAAGFTSVIDYLNDKYPDGLVNSSTVEGIQGKVVTYGDPQTSQKEFYGFNYNYSYHETEDSYKWYYLGMIADSGYRDAVLVTQNEYTAQDLSDLNVNGLAFKIVKQDNVLMNDLPKYWNAFYESA